ncbi:MULTISPECIES: type I restriction enzyme HsdR N-terminal domain-containing protein [unclassified Myroides]|uniref:type I restriction enzyme HsdR N-terminal domain-containing protein n=1 Tax=unclassified Myroides TaxID=2642485 RepID=UPI0015F80E10|nr:MULTISPECIES: type I restriction enzyme HsdR N-terminal domain-containing protein [unclassified Myroides]MBB1150125.1 type I restriction enzyme HsdR N-terminal domain-containing protein [Myroides sp. NP-2]MDM1408358.1 type I restriction enzyme HsdR N-terminal domain-containing protein [Myroides sp. DF42-4-2]
MQRLNFPSFDFRFKNSENKISIFDVIRKKFILLTPEEWVRQHVVHDLMVVKGYPISLISVEKIVKINGMNKRYDVVVFRPNGEIEVLVECKAPSVAITQQTFDQIARYNFQLRATHLYVTNGLQHYFCQMDYEKESYFFLRALPNYSSLKTE